MKGDSKGATLESNRQLGLSARGYTHVLKAARTIADLSGSDTVEAHRVAEALQFRLLE